MADRALVINEIERKMNIVLDDKQREAALSDGNVRIAACAGSGKTTTLSVLLGAKVINGEVRDTNRILCTTFSRSGAKELENRINTLIATCGDSVSSKKRIRVMTIHKLALEIMKECGVDLYDSIIDENEAYNIIKVILSSYGIKKYEDIKEVQACIGYMVNNMFTLKQMESRIPDTITIDDFSEIVRKYTFKKEGIHKIDFDDILVYMENWVSRSEDNYVAIQNYIKSKWDEVYMDEFQDTSKIQFNIIKALIGENTQFKVVGDDDQSIYEWRGTNPDIMINIGAYFNTKTIVIDTNYRCREKIVKYAKNSVECMAERIEKDIKANRPDGEISIIQPYGKEDLLTQMGFATDSDDNDEAYAKFNDILSTIEYRENKEEFRMNNNIMCAKVCDDIHKNLLDYRNILPKDICVIVRNNWDASILGAMLFEKGIMSNMANPMMLHNSSYFQVIQSFINAALMEDSMEDIHNICKNIKFFGNKGAKTLLEMRTVHKMTTRELLVCYSSDDEAVRNRIGLQYRNLIYNSYGAEVLSSIRSLGTCMSNEDERKRVGNTLYWVTRYCVRPLAEIADYLMSVLKKFNSIDEYKDFIHRLTIAENAKFDPDDCVKFETAHGSKGMEWKIVYVLKDTNIEFFNTNRLDNLVSDQERSKYIDEERRLHYVACTRAKDKLIICQDIMLPSEFSKEAVGMSDNLKAIPKKCNDTIIKDFTTSKVKTPLNRSDMKEYIRLCNENEITIR